MRGPAGRPAADLVDLDHHGDRDAAPGLVDLAVNVRSPAPGWLVPAITHPDTWTGYPDPAAARAALASRHGLDERCVLPTAGATEAFTLLARGLGPPGRAAVVHPQFTEGEAALRRAGWVVDRLLLSPADDFSLGTAAPASGTDVVLVGNPTNPTGVLHSPGSLRALARPGGLLVVDEAFMDFVPDGSGSMLARRSDLTGVLVIRSLTKMWGIPGVRAGYVAGDPALVARLAAQQPPWSVGGAALAALVACSSPGALAEAARAAREAADRRDHLVTLLTRLGLPVSGTPRTPFVLVDTAPWGPGVREALARRGVAVRRGDTFPGLGPAWIRVAVRDRTSNEALAAALTALRDQKTGLPPVTPMTVPDT